MSPFSGRCLHRYSPIGESRAPCLRKSPADTRVQCAKIFFHGLRDLESRADIGPADLAACTRYFHPCGEFLSDNTLVRNVLQFQLIVQRCMFPEIVREFFCDPWFEFRQRDEVEEIARPGF